MLSQEASSTAVTTVQELCKSIDIATAFLHPVSVEADTLPHLTLAKDSLEKAFGPIQTSFRVHITNAIFSNIYAHYEMFINELFEEYVEQYLFYEKENSNSYENLNDKFKSFHSRTLAARITDDAYRGLSKIDRLSQVRAEITGLVSGHLDISIDRKIVRLEHNNYRATELTKCCNRIGADGYYEFVRTSKAVQQYFGCDEDSAYPKFQVKLAEIVGKRNELMHNYSPSINIGRDQAIDYAEFLVIVVDTINEHLGESLTKKFKL